MAQVLRMCICCRAHKDKNKLKRVVKTASGAIFVDSSGKSEGRGAYVCSTECFVKCKKGRLLNRAFKCEVKADVYDELQAQLGNMVDNDKGQN